MTALVQKSLLAAVNRCDLRCLLNDEVDLWFLRSVGNWFHVLGAAMLNALSRSHVAIMERRSHRFSPIKALSVNQCQTLASAAAKDTVTVETWPTREVNSRSTTCIQLR